MKEVRSPVASNFRVRGVEVSWVTPVAAQQPQHRMTCNRLYFQGPQSGSNALCKEAGLCTQSDPFTPAGMGCLHHYRTNRYSCAYLNQCLPFQAAPG